MKNLIAFLIIALPVVCFAEGPEPAPWWQRVEDTQTFALKWIGSLTVILGALATLLGFIVGKVNELKERVKRQSEKMESQQAQITNIALASPSTSPSNVVTVNSPTPQSEEPIKAEITNSLKNPVPVKEGK